MSTDDVAAAEEKVRFLGRVIASISHELKNALATVHETAGLLGDIVRAAGDPAEDAEEIRGCVETVSEELERSFRIIANLNAFAHSADHAVKDLDPEETARLTASLASYLSFAGLARIERRGSEPVRVTTCPLLLEDLLYRILEAGFRAGGRDAEIAISIGCGKDGAEFRISGLGSADPGAVLAAETRQILDELAGDAVFEEGGGEVRVRLRALEGGPPRG